MKRMLTIGVLVLFYIHGMGEYYYYKGEKHALKINPDSVTIYMRNLSKSNGTNAIRSYTIARSELNNVVKNDSIDILSIEYIIGDTNKVKMSNCFYVQLKEYTDTTILKALVKETNTLLVGEVPYIDKWYKIMVENSIASSSLELSNYFYETGYFADIDPGFIIDYRVNNASNARSDSQWALNEINAYEAWNVTTGNSDIRVAIVDQGIEQSHTEFVGTNFIYSYDCSRYMEMNTIYGYHGTFIAGIISASHNHGILSGVAPNVSLISISHPIDGDNMSEELALGIRWAVLRGADVINCSWGDWGGIFYHQMHSALLEYVLLDAATEGRGGKGCVIVFGSGNQAEDGLPIDYPGRFTPEMLVVGAMNTNHERASRSAYGRSLDVLAPGDNIYSSVLNNQYKNDGGTSFAAAYVSGLAALVLSINPELTREELINIIESTTQKVGGNDYNITEGRPNGTWHEEMGYGLVDAYAALLAAQPKYIQNQVYQSGQEAYEYATEITAGFAVKYSKPFGNVVLEAWSDVTLRGMDRVVLKPGFHAKTGSKLHIKVDAPTATQATAAPQRIAPKTSSIPTNDADSTIEKFANNGLETMASLMIVSTSIYTVSGQLLQTIAGGQYDASHLPSGMYILQHRMSNGSVRIEKITNNR